MTFSIIMVDREFRGQRNNKLMWLISLVPRQYCHAPPHFVQTRQREVSQRAQSAVSLKIHGFALQLGRTANDQYSYYGIANPNHIRASKGLISVSKISIALLHPTVDFRPQASTSPFG
jgi:hypothetical protein